MSFWGALGYSWLCLWRGILPWLVMPLKGHSAMIGYAIEGALLISAHLSSTFGTGLMLSAPSVTFANSTKTLPFDLQTLLHTNRNGPSPACRSLSPLPLDLQTLLHTSQNCPSLAILLFLLWSQSTFDQRPAAIQTTVQNLTLSVSVNPPFCQDCPCRKLMLTLSDFMSVNPWPKTAPFNNNFLKPYSFCFHVNQPST